MKRVRENQQEFIRRIESDRLSRRICEEAAAANAFQRQAPGLSRSEALRVAASRIKG